MCTLRRRLHGSVEWAGRGSALRERERYREIQRRTDERARLGRYVCKNSCCWNEFILAVMSLMQLVCDAVADVCDLCEHVMCYLLQ